MLLTFWAIACPGVAPRRIFINSSAVAGVVESSGSSTYTELLLAGSPTRWTIALPIDEVAAMLTGAAVTWPDPPDVPWAPR
jgi:hypothetical protein